MPRYSQPLPIEYSTANQCDACRFVINDWKWIISLAGFFCQMASKLAIYATQYINSRCCKNLPWKWLYGQRVNGNAVINQLCCICSPNCLSQRILEHTPCLLSRGCIGRISNVTLGKLINHEQMFNQTTVFHIIHRVLHDATKSLSSRVLERTELVCIKLPKIIFVSKTYVHACFPWLITAKHHWFIYGFIWSHGWIDSCNDWLWHVSQNMLDKIVATPL